MYALRPDDLRFQKDRKITRRRVGQSPTLPKIMDIATFKNLFPIKLPIAKNGVFWNGRPDEFNNIGNGLDYSQEFGMTPYAKTGIYGQYNGEPRPHNGHDFAGARLTHLVAPCRVWCSFVADDQNNPKGADAAGYGNYCFVETETIMLNGVGHKMEFVLGHQESVSAQRGKWYDAGQLLGYMGSTGMSSGSHVHFGGRPLITGSDGAYKWASDDQAARGYVDLTDFFITKPIYNKQLLLNERMKLIKKKGASDIYAVDPMGKANLILNWATYQAGLTMGIWEDKTEEVNELPELGQIIILTPNN